jgi:hypothetical protein
MSIQNSDNVVALFADLGVELGNANEPVGLVIDRFDQWCNDARSSTGLSGICTVDDEPHAA